MQNFIKEEGWKIGLVYLPTPLFPLPSSCCQSTWPGNALECGVVDGVPDMKTVHLLPSHLFPRFFVVVFSYVFSRSVQYSPSKVFALTLMLLSFEIRTGT